MEVKIKLLHKNAIVPSYAHDGDAGLDCTCVSMDYNNERNQVTYKLGFALELPEGYAAFLFPRSSVKNYCLDLSNAVAVIDSPYRGELSVVFNRTMSVGDLYAIGDRVCQMVIMPVPKIELIKTETLSDTIRGTKGFGSSGK